MMNNTAAKVELPSHPVPACIARTTAQQVVNAQPKAITPMSIENDEVLRLRGGCGCIVGGVNVETG